jgi:hypothetical protein
MSCNFSNLQVFLLAFVDLPICDHLHAVLSSVCNLSGMRTWDLNRWELLSDDKKIVDIPNMPVYAFNTRGTSDD